MQLQPFRKQKNINRIKNNKQNNLKIYDKQKQISDLTAKYQLHIKQQQKLQQILSKQHMYRIFRWIENKQKLLKLKWNNLLPVYIRGPCTNYEYFLQSIENNKNIFSIQQYQQLINISQVISKSTLQQDLQNFNKCVCIFYSSLFFKSFVEQIIGFFMEKLKIIKNNGIIVHFIDVWDGDKNRDKLTNLVKQIKDNMLHQVQRNKKCQQNSLKQITNILNVNDNNLKPAQTHKKFITPQNLPHSTYKQFQNQQIFPFFTLFYKSIFKQTILLKSSNLNEISFEQINEIFNQRQNLQKQVTDNVQRIKQNKMNLNISIENHEMDSIHKIQISALKNEE